MKQTEFDRFADEYYASHARNISASGEAPEFFAEYKIVDTARLCRSAGLAPKRILDFGCGVGSSIPYFAKYFPDSHLVGADVSPRSLQIAGDRFGHLAELVTLDEGRPNVPASDFDLIFSACVFHHIDHDEHIGWLSELRRVARPQGLLVVFEHNPWNPLTAHAVNTCEFDENAKLMTPFTLRRNLEAAGWHDPRHEYRIFFPRILAALRPLERRMAWLPLGAQHLVVGRA